MNKQINLMTIFFGILLFLCPSTIQAQDNCVQTWSDLEKFKKESGGNLELKVAATNVQGVVSYAHFDSLRYQKPIPNTRPFGKFFGTKKQFFNDRLNGIDQPFSVKSTDNLQVEIARAGSGLLITFTLLSWNNGKITFEPSCKESLMYGYSKNGKTFYVLRFNKIAPTL